MSILTELLSSGVRAEIFRLLFGIANHELHVREIERRSGFADATVRQELKRLLGLGLIESRRDGNRMYYRANTGHPIYPDIRNLVLKTSGLVEVLSRALVSPDIGLAFVFGSVAARTESAESDVDLMVIGDVSLRRIGKMLSGVSATLGREINPHVLTVQEFARRKSSGEHFVSTVLKEPKLFVTGTEHELETMGGQRLVAPSSEQ